MSKEKYIVIKKNWCKKCYMCVEFCPKAVFKIGKDGYPDPVDLEKCTECRMCITLCPDFAVIPDPNTKKDIEDR